MDGTMLIIVISASSAGIRNYLPEDDADWQDFIWNWCVEYGL